MISPATPVSVERARQARRPPARRATSARSTERGQRPVQRHAPRSPSTANDPGQLNESGSRGDGDDVPRRDQGALSHAAAAGACSRPTAQQLEAKILAEAQVRTRRTTSPRPPNASCSRRPSPTAPTSADLELPGPQHRRVLRPVQARVLPVLRHDDGRHPARRRASRPASSRASCRATLDTRTGIETIQFSDAHAWVEVYFPGYGWVGSIRPARPSRDARSLPTGTPVASAPPRAVAERSRPPARGDPDERDRTRSGGVIGRAAAAASARSSVVGVLLLVVVVVRRFVAWRRGPRGPVTADGAYGIGDPPRLAVRVRAAADPDRLRVRDGPGRGAARRPAGARDRGAGQGRGRPTAARSSATTGIASLREAQRRLRVSLLRLAFRRADRPARR